MISEEDVIVYAKECFEKAGIQEEKRNYSAPFSKNKIWSA